MDRDIESLRSSDLIIYVKGTQKVEWLKSLLNVNHADCRNIEEIGCNFRLSDCASCRLSCGHHKHKVRNCALQSVGLLETWYHNLR